MVYGLKASSYNCMRLTHRPLCPVTLNSNFAILKTLKLFSIRVKESSVFNNSSILLPLVKFSSRFVFAHVLLIMIGRIIFFLFPSFCFLAAFLFLFSWVLHFRSFNGGPNRNVTPFLQISSSFLKNSFPCFCCFNLDF